MFHPALGSTASLISQIACSQAYAQFSLEGRKWEHKSRKGEIWSRLIHCHTLYTSPPPPPSCPAAAQKQGNWIPCPKAHLPTQSVLVTLWTLPFSCLSPSFSYLISSRKTDKPPSPPLPSGLCCLPSHAQRHKVLRHKSIFPSSDAHRYGSTLLNPAISHPNPFFWRCGITAPGWPQL